MDIGSGLAILAVGGTITAAILRFVPNKRNNPGSNSVKESDLIKVEENVGDLKKRIVFMDTCIATHKDVSNQLRTVNDGIKEIKGMLRKE